MPINADRVEAGSPVLCWADEIDSEELLGVYGFAEPNTATEGEAGLPENPSCCGGARNAWDEDTGTETQSVTASSSMDEAPQEPRPQLCEQHTLVQFTARDGSYTCGGCGVVAQEGTKLLGCSNCPYDVCAKCMEATHAETQGLKVPTAPLLPTLSAQDYMTAPPVTDPAQLMLQDNPIVPVQETPQSSPSYDFAIVPAAFTPPPPPPTSYGHRRRGRASYNQHSRYAVNNNKRANHDHNGRYHDHNGHHHGYDTAPSYDYDYNYSSNNYGYNQPPHWSGPGTAPPHPHYY